MTPEEKAAAKAAAVAKAKAIAAAKLQAKQEEEGAGKPLSEMTEEEKREAKAAAVAKAKAAAAARLQTTAEAGEKKKVQKEATTANGKSVLEKKISKKMAFSILLFTILIVATSGILLMKIANWNGYSSGTEVEKQYRASLQKLKEHPEDLEVRYELMAAMYKKGLQQEAQAQLQYIMEHAEADSSIQLKSLYYKGLYHTMNGEDVEAIAAYERFLTVDPGVGEAWLNLSYAYYSQGQYDEAAAAAGKAGVLLPSSPDVPYLHGMLLYEDGKKAEAKIMFEKALELDRRHEKSTEMLAQLQKEEKA